MSSKIFCVVRSLRIKLSQDKLVVTGTTYFLLCEAKIENDDVIQLGDLRLPNLIIFHHRIQDN